LAGLVDSRFAADRFCASFLAPPGLLALVIDHTRPCVVRPRSNHSGAGWVCLSADSSC
jgi:hypothetical protein